MKPEQNPTPTPAPWRGLGLTVLAPGSFTETAPEWSLHCSPSGPRAAVRPGNTASARLRPRVCHRTLDSDQGHSTTPRPCHQAALTTSLCSPPPRRASPDLPLCRWVAGRHCHGVQTHQAPGAALRPGIHLSAWKPPGGPTTLRAHLLQVPTHHTPQPGGPQVTLHFIPHIQPQLLPPPSPLSTLNLATAHPEDSPACPWIRLQSTHSTVARRLRPSGLTPAPPTLFPGLQGLPAPP